jgi:hypothetical protein
MLIWRHPQVEHVKTKEMRKYNKMNHLELLLHLHKQTTTPPTMKKKMMMRMFQPNLRKISHELEQEFQEIIPSNKSLMTFKPGDPLSL